MPRKQSTGSAGRKKTKSTRRDPYRALNAFAIAEDEDGEKSEGGSHFVDPDLVAPKRKRDGDDDEHEDGEIDGNSGSKRPRRGDLDKYGNEIEGGSDSEGNEWVIGAVGSDDDSSIDSDEAMGGNDYQKLSKPKVAQRDSTEVNDLDVVEDNESRQGAEQSKRYDSDEESEDFAANAVDLATALDDSGDEEPNQSYSRKGHGSQARSSSFEFEEDNLDDADSIAFSISDAEEPDEGDYTALRSFITSLDASDLPNKSLKSRLDLSQEAMTPSDFNINPKKNLSISDLLATIPDPTMRTALKSMTRDDEKTVQPGKGVPGKLAVPLPKRQQDRLDRAAAFEKTKQTLDRWMDTVKHNRRAEHLIFPLVDQDIASAKNTKRLIPITKSEAISGLESTIQDILAESGLSGNGKSQEKQIQEFEELAANKMPIEEMKARRAELRRTRELLFREEIRAKRIKKIKSKSYRRVHRKERERNLLREKEALAAAGIVRSEDEQERVDRQRAEERMGQRHRQSRWAKSVRDTGRAAWDEEAREGVNDLARRDEELRRRMQGKDAKDEESLGSESESSEDDASTEDEDGFAARMKDKIDRVGNVLDRAPENRLLSMKFMRNAEAARKGQNDEAIEQLRKELYGKESEEDSDSEGEELGRRRYGPKANQSEPSINIQKQGNEFEERPGSDDGDGVSSNGGEAFEDVDIVIQEKSRNTNAPAETAGHKGKVTPQPPKKQVSEPQQNPWLVIPKKSSKTKSTADDSLMISTVPQLSTRSSQRLPSPKRIETNGNDMSRLDQEDENDSDASFAGFSPSPPSNLEMDNRSLIRQAFAADDVLAEETFAAEKAALAVEEEPSKPTSTALPGWGTWVGPALSKKERKQANRASTTHDTNGGNRNQLSKSSEGIPLEKRADAKLQKVIISEKRVPKNAKYLANALPHPFENRAQYERSLRLPMGPEFTTKETFQMMTKPRVLVKPGVIGPMRRPLM